MAGEKKSTVWFRFSGKSGENKNNFSVTFEWLPTDLKPTPVPVQAPGLKFLSLGLFSPMTYPSVKLLVGFGETRLNLSYVSSV